MATSGRTKLCALAAAAALALLAAAGSSARAEYPAPDSAGLEGAIFERQNIMMQLDRDAKLLGEIVAGLAPADKLAATTRAIADGAKDATESFRTPLPGGRSKPEVWSNHTDFMQRMESFARNAGAMAKAGETGNVAAATGLIIDALPCKQCHDLYRQPKRP